MTNLETESAPLPPPTPVATPPHDHRWARSDDRIVLGVAAGLGRALAIDPLLIRIAFVVLGLLSSKSSQLEAVDDLRRRIDAASRYVALDRLAISPQCGFASSVGGNPLTIDDQRRKLARVVEVAELVWG